MKKLISIFSLILGAIPLLLYPAILIANIMSWSGNSQDSISFLTKIVVLLFLWGSTLYPAIYIGCLLKYRQTKLIKYCFYPLYYLGIIILLGFIWNFLDT